MATITARARKAGQLNGDPSAPLHAALVGVGPVSALSPDPGPQHMEIIDLVNHEYYGTSGNDTFAAPTDDNWYLSGQAGNDTLSGRGGDDLFIGGLGGDVMIGQLGADYYYVDTQFDLVYEAAGEGVDRVLASVSYQLASHAEVETLSTDSVVGTAAINLIGNDFVNIIVGNAGDNTIDGRGGGDIMIGHGGADYYYVNIQNDFVFEAVGGGVDRVLASTSYQLQAGAEVETLSTDFLAGTDAIALTGNEFVNIIVGNAGNNVIDGRAGGDLMIGFGGDDHYHVGQQNDFVYESIGAGNDRVFASASYQLGAGVEVETLSTNFNAGTDALNLIGNEFVNTIIGNAGANMLDGRGGADAMTGFGGDDQYYVDNAADAVNESTASGNDRVLASVSYALGAGTDVETLSTTFNAGTDAIDLAGNNLANTIIGNAGNNVIDGGAGNDTLISNGGNDTFAFTTALGAGNVDTVADFNVASDTIRLGGGGGEPFVLLASGALGAGSFVIGTGAADANDYLIYNSGTGALMYDADGSGAGAAVQFATLSTGLALTEADFIVSGPANTAPAVTSGGAASVAENSPQPTVVYQAAATDANGDRITWSLSGTDASLLTINAVTGAVTLNASADFEVKNSYAFNVVASDSGSSTSQAVTLTITNVTEAATPIVNETTQPNDSRFTAQSLSLGTFLVADNPNLFDDSLPSITIDGSISANNDKDFFSITLEAGQLLVLDIDGTSGGLDAFLRLLFPNGDEVGINDDLVDFDPGSVPTIAQHNTDSQIRFRAGTSGTYFFAVESFEGTSAGDYLLHVSIGPAATAAQLVEEDIQALISGSEWDHPNLTYGFPTAANQYPTNFEEIDEPGEFAPFTAAQQAATIQLLGLAQSVSGLTFAQNTATPGQADLRFAMSDEPEVAYAFYPTNNGPSSPGGSAWFNKDDFNDPRKGNYDWMGILHEAGHALGLKHGHEFPVAISSDRDSVEYSVMTYRSYPGQDLADGGGYTNGQWSFAQTLMMYDIAALQRMYGANFNFNNTSTTYTWSSTTGEMSLNGVGQGAPGDGNGTTTAAENRIFMTIWDGGGSDTYNLSNYTTTVLIDLRPGEWTTTSGAQLANLGNGNSARGNIANALQFEGSVASLIENAVGGAGADTITANQAANQLTGNGGADTFRWAAASDAAPAALDTVADFSSAGGDKIDLSAIDAIPGGADNGFAFIGTGAFTSTAGQLRYEVISGHANIFADIDGNGVADMQIFVANVATLAASDFIL